MDVLGDAIARGTRTSATALRAPAVGRTYDYRRFCTSAWKTGNFLRHLGVRRGDGVAVADDPLPEPVLSLYGAALLGGVASFGPPEDGLREGVRALVVPAAGVGAYAVGPSTKRIVYGDPPDDPSVSYFERDVWSENPTEPPDRIAPEDPLLATPEGVYSHRAVLSAAAAAVDEFGIDADTAVAVRGSFADPGVVAAGLVAPVVAGGTVAVGPGADGDVVVGEGSEVDAAALAPEPTEPR